jgi:hypothetical protein
MSTFDTSERQRLLGGIAALALATICILSLQAVQTGGMVGGTLLGLLTVACLVVGTLSIGTSEQARV